MKESNPYVVSDVVKQLDAAAPEYIRVRPENEATTGGFLNLFGVSSTFNKSKNETYVAESVKGSALRTPSERETYIKEKAEKYLKQNPSSHILDVVGS